MKTNYQVIPMKTVMHKESAHSTAYVYKEVCTETCSFLLQRCLVFHDIKHLCYSYDCVTSILITFLDVITIEQLNIERPTGVSLILKIYPDTYQLIGPQKSLNFKTNKTNVKWPKTKVSYETIMNDNILSFIFV